MWIGLHSVGTHYTPSVCWCQALAWVPHLVWMYSKVSNGVRSLKRKTALKKRLFFFFLLFLSHSCNAQEENASMSVKSSCLYSPGKSFLDLSCPQALRAAIGRQRAAYLQGSLNQLAWILPSPRILACKTDFVHIMVFECTLQIDS